MKKLFFQKPTSLTEWIIFIIGTPIALSSPYGARRIGKELFDLLTENIPPEDSDILVPGKVSQVIYRLKKRKIIEVSEKNGIVEIKLTEKGKKRKISGDLNKLSVEKPAEWDGKWRMVMFDIPESKKSARESLRDKLKQLGLFQFQKSVWIYPYNCQKEIDFVADTFNVREYITVLTVKIDDDGPLKTYFNID